MAVPARTHLESLLRARKLDRTLTSSLPAPERLAEQSVAFDLPALDAALAGGVPRGQLSEIAGPASSGRTGLLTRLLASATRRGELAALVDPLDRFDAASAACGGVDLRRLLWVRGVAAAAPSRAVEGALDRAIKAAHLVLQAGDFAVVALDLADVPSTFLRRIPFTTWLRLQRAVEHGNTAALLVTPMPLARSSAGLTLLTAATTHARWNGISRRSSVFTGLSLDVRIVRARFRRPDEHPIAVRLDAPASDRPCRSSHASSSHATTRAVR